MLVRLLVCPRFEVSNASVEQMREERRNLTLMVQADMIAYHEPGEPPQLGLPETYVSSVKWYECLILSTSVNSIGTPEVAQLVANVSAMYSPELVVGFTPVCLQSSTVHCAEPTYLL